MEELMRMHGTEDRDFLDCGLPEYLKESVENMKIAWEKKDRGEKNTIVGTVIFAICKRI